MSVNYGGGEIGPNFPVTTKRRRMEETRSAIIGVARVLMHGKNCFGFCHFSYYQCPPRPLDTHCTCSAVALVHASLYIGGE